MKCPSCRQAQRGHPIVSVRDQRAMDAEMNQQYRDRGCRCGHEWTTIEVLESDLLHLRKLAHAAVMAGVKA